MNASQSGGQTDRGRMLVMAIAVAALVAAGALLILRGSGAEVARAGPAANLNLDHFQCYSAKFDPSNPVGATIALRDQFGGPTKHKVRSPRFFCNPVQKIHGANTFPIINRNNHLTAYPLTGKVPRKKLYVWNQFQRGDPTARPNLILNPGTSTRRTHPLILVPTQKSPHGRPGKLDHFKCYPVRRSNRSTINVPVVLNDQFLNRDAKVLTAILLCNPAKKWHGNKIVPVTNRKAHLVCYSTSRHPFPSGNEPTRTIRNQFAKHQMTALVARMLCVPSRKKVAT